MLQVTGSHFEIKSKYVSQITETSRRIGRTLGKRFSYEDLKAYQSYLLLSSSL